jgi:hypothetical protein
MNLRKILSGMLVMGAVLTSASSITHAEYITAYEEIKYDKYIVDTDSFFYPNKNNMNNEFNCIVWHYTSNDDKGQPYTFRFKYENNTWKIAERKGKGEDLVWVTVEANSVASDVLRVSLPSIGKTNIVKH